MYVHMCMCVSISKDEFYVRICELTYINSGINGSREYILLDASLSFVKKNSCVEVSFRFLVT